MTILIIGYVATVCLACYFVNKFARENRIYEQRLRNYKVWLGDSNEALFNKADECRVAYKTIDRYEDLLHKYGHFDVDTSDPVADAIAEAIVEDKVVCAGIYYDEDGNPILDQLDWTPQEGVTYSESDDSDV